MVRGLPHAFKPVLQQISLREHPAFSKRRPEIRLQIRLLQRLCYYIAFGADTESCPILATLRLRGMPGRDVVKVHCRTVLGDVYLTWRQIRPIKTVP